MIDVDCDGLSLAYGSRPAFRDVSLHVPGGGVTAIIGPSGCGKSSFLTAINRLCDLVPDCRVEGRLRVGETEVTAPGVDLTTLRRRVGMVFQKPNPFPLSIHRNLDLPLRHHGTRRRAERDALIERALADVGLWDEVKDRLKQPALRLSGGQQQRLCIARALVLRPEVMLFDEPTSALDPLASAVVEDLVRQLAERYTVIVVTHNLRQARRIADRVAFFWMVDGCGRLVEQGSVEEIFERPQEAMTAAYVQGDRG